MHAAIQKEVARTDLFRMLVADRIHPTLLDGMYFQEYGLLNEPLARKLLKNVHWDKTSYGYALTNVGRVDIPTKYGPLKLAAVVGLSFYPHVDEKVVNAVTVGGRLTLTLDCNASVLGEGTAKRLRNSARRHLLAAKRAPTRILRTEKV